MLRPELAAALGPDRFPREIKIVAQLSHPHILPLHDSGEIEGFLYYVYYVMPYAEGESLRSRLRREHELPIPDAGLAASAKPGGHGVCASLALGVRGGQ